MTQTVIGIFENSSQAQDAKSYLLANGFSSENVDINYGNSSYNTSDSKSSTRDLDGRRTDDDDSFGSRISRFFKNLFTNEDEAASHISAARKGTTVTVHAQTANEAETAAEILNNYGAVDVDEYNRKSAEYSGSSDAGNIYDTTRSTDDSDTSDTIKVIIEDLQVGKREVETGGVRLRSRIVERPVEESIRLREEHVNVERNSVDRPATEADFSNFKEGTVDVTEHAERPVVSKTARVVEEVSLEKEVSEREEKISDTVRHTEVDTEDIASREKTYEDDKATFDGTYDNERTKERERKYGNEV